VQHDHAGGGLDATPLACRHEANAARTQRLLLIFADKRTFAFDDHQRHVNARLVSRNGLTSFQTDQHHLHPLTLSQANGVEVLGLESGEVGVVTDERPSVVHE